MAAPQGSAGQQDNVTTMHRYKIPPPYYNGEYATYEEWRYKFLAYIGLQDPEFPELIQLAEDANQQITNALIDQVIADPDKATRWKRLAADLHYILVNICTGPAATVCRQNLLNTNGLETWRQLRHRFSIPTGTRSVGSQNFSSQHWTKTSLKKPLHNGNTTYNGTNKTTEHHYQTESK